VRLSNSFTIARPVPEVYEALLDVERIATCMPGSRLLGQPEPGTYEGEVKVKVGPLSVAYSGRFAILEADKERRMLTMRAKGREQHGAGNASAHVVAMLTEHADGTLIQIDTDLDIRGKVAQFGRGVLGEVTEGIVQGFASNVEQLLASSQRPALVSTAPGARPVPRDAPEPDTPTAHGTAQQHMPSAPVPAANEIGGLDAWRLIVRPMLGRRAGALVTIGLSGLAAYLGARMGARHPHRSE
jgi:carbon monoxide dehydrogenase subunit G